VIPPDHNAEFVATMEDVLEVYHRPYDPGRPVVCFDEASPPLIKETRVPIAAAPGRPATSDYEYERHGTANLFMMFEPLTGRRPVQVTERRTAVDYADVIRELVDVHDPRARTIVLVQDNLTTHKPASLDEAFPPEEARRIVEKLEIHYTPKHGSWLNMAETELSVLSRQCLDRHMPDHPTITAEVGTWEIDRNRAEWTVDWQFTTADARVKLKRLYPVIEPVKPAVADHLGGKRRVECMRDIASGADLLGLRLAALIIARPAPDGPMRRGPPSAAAAKSSRPARRRGIPGTPHRTLVACASGLSSASTSRRSHVDVFVRYT
jgi:hypothetical protein